VKARQAGNPASAIASSYAALSNPKPLAAEDIQRQHGDDEALLLFVAGKMEGYVFALSRDAFD